MKKCAKCERPLRDEEETLCPACVSNDDRKVKSWFEIMALVATAVVVGLTIFRSGSA